MTSIAFISVILRYGFEIHILWETQILPFVFVWGVFLGAASVTRDHSHIRVSFFAELIFGEKRALKVWTTVENVAGLAACIFITYLSVRWVHAEYVSGAVVISKPSYGLWIPHLAITIGMGLMSIFSRQQIRKRVVSTPVAETSSSQPLV